MAAAEWREHVASQAVAAAQHRAWAVEEGARVLRVRLDAGSAPGANPPSLGRRGSRESKLCLLQVCGLLLRLGMTWMSSSRRACLTCWVRS